MLMLVKKQTRPCAFEFLQSFSGSATPGMAQHSSTPGTVLLLLCCTGTSTVLYQVQGTVGT